MPADAHLCDGYCHPNSGPTSEEWRLIGEAITDHREGAKVRIQQLEDAIRQHRNTVQSGEEPWDSPADERLWVVLDRGEDADG